LTLPTPSQAPKALGIHWDVEHDMLHVSTPTQIPTSEAVTKRIIASGTAGVFDVLGLFAPAIIPARILLQEMWKRSLTWDEPVPTDIRDKWNVWVHDLPIINNYSIPRRLSNSNVRIVFRALHGFSDASSVAYGAAIYLRCVCEDGSITVTLVTAKARVLPVKPVTIPKAELLGAHLLAKMLHGTRKILEIATPNMFTWTDSEIVIHWLSKLPSQLDRFVANRVQSIRELLPHTNWRHVRSADNPSDLASRGVRATDLVKSDLWWNGPPWLGEPPDHWPSRSISSHSPSVPCLSVQPVPQSDDGQTQFLHQLWSTFSSFNVLSSPPQK